MNLKITPRDRLFAAILIPLLLLAAYLFLVRAPLARSVERAGTRLAALGDADTLRATRVTFDRRLAETRAALQAAEAPDSDAPSTPAPTPSDRLRHTIALLSSPNLHLQATDLLATGPDASPSAPLVQEALFGAPSTLWRFTIQADYPTLLSALRALAADPAPALVERATLAAPRTWTLDITL